MNTLALEWKEVPEKELGTELRKKAKMTYLKTACFCEEVPEERMQTCNIVNHQKQGIREGSMLHFDRLLGASAMLPISDNPGGAMGAEGGRKDGFNALIISTGLSLADGNVLLSFDE